MSLSKWIEEKDLGEITSQNVLRATKQKVNYGEPWSPLPPERVSHIKIRLDLKFFSLAFTNLQTPNFSNEERVIGKFHIPVTSST